MTVLPRAARARARARPRRRHGHVDPRADLDARARLPRPRELLRDPQRHAPRRDPEDPRGVPRPWAATPSRPTPSAARRSCWPSSASPSAARELNRAGRRRWRARPATPLDARAAALRARLDGPGHEARRRSATSSYDDAASAAYREQARGLARGRRRRLPDRDLPGPAADQGRGQRRAGGARGGRTRRSRSCVSVTMEVTGTMLVGTEMAAAIALLDPVPDRRGRRSTAPPARARWASTCACSARPAASAIGVYPNAGLPQLVDGQPHYPLTPEELADWLVRFVEEDGVNARRRLLRHDARAPGRGRARGARAGAEAAQAVARPAARSRASTAPCRCCRTTRSCSSASARTPTARKAVPRAPARPATSTAWSRWAASRCATAATCSTCARPTSAATRSPT